MENKTRITRSITQRGCKRVATGQQRQELKDIANCAIVTKPRKSLCQKNPRNKRRKVTPPKQDEAEMNTCLELVEQPVLNIDQDDASDPQSVTDYIDDIYEYMRQLEKQYTIGKVRLISDDMVAMRAVLIDWLIEVHLQFKFLQETLYLTINILDRFLHAKAPKIRKKMLQLVGVTAMFLASKYEEMYPPEITDFVYVTDNTYSTSQIRTMEILMLTTLEFNTSPPLLINFLRRYSKAGQVEVKVHILAKYVLESSLLDYNLSTMYPSLLAAGALAYALRATSKKPMAELWDSTLAFYTRVDIATVTNLVAKISVMMSRNACKPVDAKLQSVRRKFSHWSYERMAESSFLKELW